LINIVGYFVYQYLYKSINQVYFQATRRNIITNTRSCDSNKKTEKLQNCTNYRKKIHIMKPAEIIIINIFIISGNNTHIKCDKQITTDRRKQTE